MATSKAQLEQQILGLSGEAPASSGPQVLAVNPAAPPAAPMSVQDQLAGEACSRVFVGKEKRSGHRDS